MRWRSLLCGAVILLAAGVAVRAEGVPSRDEIVRALLQRSRLLEDVRFRIPIALYHQYIREKQPAGAEPPPAPVAWIAEEGVYHLKVPQAGEDGTPTLAVSLRLRVFHPQQCRNLPLLSGELAWEDVKLNAQEAKLPTVDGWLRLSPGEGSHVVTASVRLKPADREGGSVRLAIPKTVRTLARFDSPGGWEVSVAGSPDRLRGSGETGTAGVLAATPRTRLEIVYRPPAPERERPARYQLRGQIAWNLGAGSQQVAARLEVAILGGPSERIDLELPAGASRLSVTGPDVRQTQVAPGQASVFLRGKIRQRTRLMLSYDLPAPAGGAARLARPDVRDGSWRGGTLVVTNTAGGSEILPERIVSLRPLALGEVPPDASAILAGPAVMAYEITAPDFAAAVEIVDLGEFALRESIADLAHYELAFRADAAPDPGGTMMCKATYEIRNRTRQFLRIALPEGAEVLVAKVSEKPVPITPLPLSSAGGGRAYLLPLVRSRASVRGLVSFPVEVVFLCRAPAVEKDGRVKLPLPRVDLPVAYAFCHAYLPEEIKVRRWSGPMRRVERFSSETATASLTYGHGILAEGYEPAARPTPGAPRPQLQPVKPARVPADRRGGDDAGRLLALNYYRAGQDFYEKGDYANAADALRQVVSLAPGSNEADNATKLLGNIRLLGGKEVLKTKQEKAAGARVRGEVAASQHRLLEEQQELLETGQRLLRQGQYEQAKSALQASEEIGKELLKRGADVREQSFRGTAAGEALSTIRQLEHGRTEELRRTLASQKARQDYVAALETAGQIQRQLGDAIDGKKLADVRAEMQQLAVLAAKKRSLQVEGKALAEMFWQRGRAPQAGTDLGRAVKAAEAGKVTHEDVARLQGALQELELRRPRDLAAEAVPPTTPAPPEPATPERIAALKEQVHALRDQHKYAEALEVVTRIRGLDPQDRWAVEMDGTLRRFLSLLREQAEGGRPPQEPREWARNAAWSAWYDQVPYPGDWAEAREGRGRRGAAPPAIEAVRQRLRRRCPSLEFSGATLPEVLEYLGAVSGVNFRVDWSALREAGVAPQARRDLKLPDEAVEQALQSLLAGAGAARPLAYAVDASGVTISTKAQLARREVTRAYDVRDLITAVPSFEGPRLDLSAAAANVAAAKQEGLFGITADDQAAEREAQVKSLNEMLRSATTTTLGGTVAEIRLRDVSNRLIVTASEERQHQVRELLEQLRRARGGQVQMGGTILRQRAMGLAGAEPAPGGPPALDVDGAGASERLREFIDRNYDWQLALRAAPATTQPAVTVDQLVGRLQFNRGQKVQVSSRNLNVDRSAAGAVGIRFVTGANGVVYAIADEAQLRTLAELEARRPPQARPVRANPRWQETIVGTDALLANRMLLNVTYAADRGNSLDISTNSILLAHEKYILIDNGSFLTAVRAGQMQHWTEPPSYIEFAEVPESIDVPRAGREVRFEKTLIEPTDELAIQAECVWKGAVR